MNVSHEGSALVTPERAFGRLQAFIAGRPEDEMAAPVIAAVPGRKRLRLDFRTLVCDCAIVKGIQE